ncbi:hypothetical protein EDB92DRAFT_204477 [Lactarius akahatsu]|uniref:Uncharacterized protein n=1 Tax=Lactarius akahatsu TaxID=416441 RepID=A0AAD4LLM1_9AGAM|nr:hypothetical protein EDB92DRAFT_204477 [Lactarius akahatsu]
MALFLTAFASSAKRNARGLMAHLSTVNPGSIPRFEVFSGWTPSHMHSIIVRYFGIKTPLENSFSQYPDSQPEPSNSPVVEFDRLCKAYHWKRKDPKREAAREKFHFAMKKEFDHLYGSDEKDINNWLKLCFVLRIDPTPDTLQKCRTAVRSKHVNLVDLVHGSKKEVQIFETEKELSKYTIATKKIFPKEDAKDGDVLRDLRRQIFAPREGTNSSRKNKGPRR